MTELILTPTTLQQPCSNTDNNVNITPQTVSWGNFMVSLKEWVKNNPEKFFEGMGKIGYIFNFLGTGISGLCHSKNMKAGVIIGDTAEGLGAALTSLSVVHNLYQGKYRTAWNQIAWLPATWGAFARTQEIIGDDALASCSIISGLLLVVERWIPEREFVKSSTDTPRPPPILGKRRLNRPVFPCQDDLPAKRFNGMLPTTPQAPHHIRIPRPKVKNF